MKFIYRDTGVSAVTKGDGFLSNPNLFYAISQYGYELGGPYTTREQAEETIIQYVASHPAKTVVSGKPDLI